MSKEEEARFPTASPSSDSPLNTRRNPPRSAAATTVTESLAAQDTENTGGSGNEESAAVGTDTVTTPANVTASTSSAASTTSQPTMSVVTRSATMKSDDSSPDGEMEVSSASVAVSPTAVTVTRPAAREPSTPTMKTRTNSAVAASNGSSAVSGTLTMKTRHSNRMSMPKALGSTTSLTVGGRAMSGATPPSSQQSPEDSLVKRRSSSRSIKRKKFDDELVESSLIKTSRGGGKLTTSATSPGTPTPSPAQHSHFHQHSPAPSMPSPQPSPPPPQPAPPPPKAPKVVEEPEVPKQKQAEVKKEPEPEPQPAPQPPPPPPPKPVTRPPPPPKKPETPPTVTTRKAKTEATQVPKPPKLSPPPPKQPKMEQSQPAPEKKKGKTIPSKSSSSKSSRSKKTKSIVPLARETSRWTAEDDLALITAVHQTNDLEQVFQGVKFSHRFSMKEIEERWYALLYDPIASKASQTAMRLLHPDIKITIMARALYSEQEEKILGAVASTSQPSADTFQDLINKNSTVFNPMRTAKSLQKHWLTMKQYHLLSDQTVQPMPRGDHVLNFSDAEDMMDDSQLQDPRDEILEHELAAFDRRQKRQIRHLENEIPKWQVLVENVTGMTAQEFDSQTLAVLRGRLVRYLMRSKEITIGRSSKDNTIDVDLSLEGPAWKVSRKQGVIKLRTNGEFYLANEGKRAVHIDGKPVLKGQKWKLTNNSVVEIAGLRFIFLINQEVISTLRTDTSAVK